MSTDRVVVPVLCLVLSLLAGAGHAIGRENPSGSPPADPNVLTYPDLSISFPTPGTFELSNGLTVYLFRDTELPIVDLALYMKAGAIYDPADRAGLASLATYLMRTGGTREMSPDEVDERLEFLPATVSIGAQRDAVYGTLSALKDRFSEALPIFAGMLREPRFDAKRIEMEKARLVEDIRRRWDDPRTIVELNFRRLIYGAASPWARFETVDSVGRISPRDLRTFHRDYVRPDNLIMGVAGDFEPRAMKRLLRDAFGSWKAPPVSLPDVPKIEDTVTPGVHLVGRPITQSSLAIGHLGVNRFDPDKFPLVILNDILGQGGFSSRLMKEVRSTRGLAYSVGGGVGIDSDRGLFRIVAQTKSGSTIEAIQVIRDVVTRLRQEGPTDDEIRHAKESNTNSFVFSVASTTAYMRSYLFYRHYGYPADYLQTYRDTLGRVTRKQIKRAARKHIDPDRLVVLVVGNPQEFDRPLTSLGLGDPRPLTLEGERDALETPAKETDPSAP